VCYPADGQKGVPPAAARAEAEVDPAAGDAGAPMGFPVTVTFSPGSRVRGVSASLRDGSGRELPVWLTHRHELAPGGQPNTVGLVPKEALAAGASYTVTVKAEVDGAEWSRSWAFATKPQR
jgi:hypothetical protein